MEKIKKNGLTIVGISARTSNQDGQAAKDIPALWEKFATEGILNKIPNKTNHTIYALYHDYVSDHTEPYTILLGCEVNSLDNIPDDMTVKMVPEANYTKFTAKGNLMGGAVIETWMEIWNSDVDRTYTTDLEIYGEEAANPLNGIAEILIATK